MKFLGLVVFNKGEDGSKPEGGLWSKVRELLDASQKGGEVKNFLILGHYYLISSTYPQWSTVIWIPKITTMLRNHKSNLQLNSYKLDSSDYEAKLQQLATQNHELKSNINRITLKQQGLQQEVSALRQETRRLTIRNSMPVIPDPSILKELERQKERTAQYRQMYENELQNKKEITEYYQKRLQSLLRDKDALINKYEQKIKILSQSTLPNFDSSTSISHRVPQFPSDLPQPHQKLKSSHSSSQSLKNSKKMGGQFDRPSYSGLDALLGLCLEKLQSMNLSLPQLRCIQQIQRFSGNRPVPKNKFIKLLREFPFQCEDEGHIDEAYQIIVTTLRSDGKEHTGSNIIHFLLTRMQQLS